MITKTILLKIKEPDIPKFKLLRQEYSKTLNLGIEYLSNLVAEQNQTFATL